MDPTNPLNASLHIPPNPRTRLLKRNRKPLSCASCRVRKLKCNREQPCQNCVVRGDVTLCLYAAKAKSDVGSKPEPPSLGRSDLGQQESRVATNDTVSSTEANIAGNGTDEIDVNPVFGVVRIEKDSSSYRGSTHWDSVLQELSAFKLAEDDELSAAGDLNADFSLDGRDAALLAGEISTYDNSGLLASLPSKAAADQLVSRFFDPGGPAGPSLYILHQPTFMRQYEQHWTNPSQTPTAYLALLFAILGLSMQSYATEDDETNPFAGMPPSLATLYRARSTHCITESTQSLTTLQATIFNSITGFSRLSQEDKSYDTMLSTIGSTVRAATRMGLHRDPRHFPNISPLAGEMRRRIWAFITQMDVLLSFHLGIPSTIRSRDSDTASPRHLFDTDLSESMSELPPSRLPEQQIPIAYLIAKNHILHVLGRIVEHLHSLHTASDTETYARVLQLDTDLESARALIPPYLQLQTHPNPLTPPPSTILLTQSLQLSLIYHQSICALHRTYLTRSLSNPTFLFCRARTLSSSLALLAHQRAIHEGSQPGGPLAHARWYGISAASHHFSLASLTLCLELRYQQRRPPASAAVTGTETEAGIRDALTGARDIWARLAGNSRDATRVARVMDTVLRSSERERETDEQAIRPSASGAADTGTTADAASNPLLPLGINAAGSGPAPDIDMGADIPDLDWNWAGWDSLLPGQSSGFDDFGFDVDAYEGFLCADDAPG